MKGPHPREKHFLLWVMRGAKYSGHRIIKEYIACHVSRAVNKHSLVGQQHWEDHSVVSQKDLLRRKSLSKEESEKVKLPDNW